MTSIDKEARIIKLNGRGAEGRDGDACYGPIRLVRTSKFTLAILFDESLFTKELLPITLRGCLRGQNLWKLYEPGANQYPGYAAFLVQVENHLFGEEIERTMRHVVENATRAAYLQELRRKHRKISVTKLPFILSQTRNEIDPVSQRTARALWLAGCATLEDIAWLTADELCKIPGMRAGDVFGIELNLAAMGFSLMTPAIPIWSSSAERSELRFPKDSDETTNTE